MKTKYRILFATMLLFACCRNNANAQVFSYDTKMGSLGYGFPNLIGSYFKKYKSYSGFIARSEGPFFGKLEFSIAEKMSLGVCADIDKVTIQYNDPNLVYGGNIWRECTSFGILARFNYHFFDSDDFDPYLGAGVGYRYHDFDISNYSNPDIIQSFGGIGFEITAGIRYFFMDNIAFYAEAGYAKAPFQGGVVFKF